MTKTEFKKDGFTYSYELEKDNCYLMIIKEEKEIFPLEYRFHKTKDRWNISIRLGCSVYRIGENFNLLDEPPLDHWESLFEGDDLDICLDYFKTIKNKE